MTAGFLIVLPPSETKRVGGNTPLTDTLTGAEAIAAGPLRWSAMEAIRADVAGELIALAAHPEATAKALKIGAALAARESERNLALCSAPRLSATLRYTGVLFDALDAQSLDAAAWQWLRDHVVVQSALYGLVGADEPIAAYRCSADSRIPGATLRARWAETISTALRDHEGTVLDLRSSAYVKLGPAPHALTIDIVSEGADGVVRALNHFNKRAKGELVRALAQAGSDLGLETHANRDEVVEVLRGLGFDARPGDAKHRLVLVVDDPRTAGAALPKAAAGATAR